MQSIDGESDQSSAIQGQLAWHRGPYGASKVVALQVLRLQSVAASQEQCATIHDLSLAILKFAFWSASGIIREFHTVLEVCIQ